MSNQASGYELGKDGEHQTWDYLRNAGFVRPSAKQRTHIASAFERRGVGLHKSAFDAVDAKFLGFLDDVVELEKIADELVMYEVKTCGVERRTPVSEGFRGMGFTLTAKERNNALTLGSNFRFIFVNLLKKSHRIYSLDDFFDAKFARIYQTWSVFVTTELAE